MSLSGVGRSQIEGKSTLASLQLTHTLQSHAGLIEALVDAACDKEDSVSDSIFKSIVDIGRKKYVIVLERCLAYLTKHNKVSYKVHPLI